MIICCSTLTAECREKLYFVDVTAHQYKADHNKGSESHATIDLELGHKQGRLRQHCKPARTLSVVRIAALHVCTAIHSPAEQL